MVVRPVDRDLDPGWYEVPPVARRHLAKPLVRGGFDAPTHPER
jgi:tRNA(Ile2)-agmatinylcytidine synthase